ncbi:Trehalose-phosphatase [Phytophthora megakarya]|uniref:Trehalose-phosphatase n=1 Tax=Phytophthora megakarya TaxID=4795 RepID=A0A225WZ21_9STRA|nr:Trehalose-phosphatase [Phytophthora megakarya]
MKVMAPPKTVLIVVNVLPLVFERNASSLSGWSVSWATGATAMLYRTLVRDAEQYSPLFIGCPEVFVAKSEEAALEKQLLKLRCVPVFLDPPVAHRYFQAELQLDCEEQEKKDWFGEKKEETGGVKSTWYDPVSWNPAAQDMCWSDYCSVNRTFARRVVESYHDGDLVWLHDFHLLMLPSYLLRRLRTALVTMYLHVPFPSSEIFRCLAMRTEILRAMLCADHIGFLTFEHARHFLTSSKRLLGLDYKTCPNGMLVIEYNGRNIHISCSHVEPDVTHLHEMLDQNEANVNGTALEFAAHVKTAITAGRDSEQRQIVIGSVDRLEGLTAIPLKLRAFDRFLAMHPDKRDSVVLVQIGITLDSRPNDYHRTRDYVLKFTEEINRRYAPPGGVVVYFAEKRKTTCAERVILWRMCDIYLDTCVRGGLSLLPFEYMIAQHRNIQSKSRNPKGWSSPRSNLDVSGLDRSFGIMIVSEFSAYNRILSGSLAVNPWKTDDMVSAFAKACGMSYYEKHNRFYLNYNFLVGKSDPTPWGVRLLTDIEAVTEKLDDGTSSEVVQVGFGFDFRVMRFESGFVSLDVDELVKKCASTSRRLFIFDYGGTLSSTASILDEEGAQFSHRGGCVENSTSDRGGDCTGQSAARYIDGKVRKPVSDETRANLRTLCADPCNIVFVTSNTQQAALEDQFGAIPNLNLIAENGLLLKKSDQSHWECVCDEDKRTFNWKDDVKRVMQAYAARTNGSFIVENAASLLYDYRNSDQEYGEIQSLELCAQLRKTVERGEATIIPAKGYVEVHQAGVSKAVAVSLILNVLKERVDVPEFAFIVGDDASDEKVFQAAHSFAEHEPQLEHIITCTVGKKPSSAKYYVLYGYDVVTKIVYAIATIDLLLFCLRSQLRLANSRVRLFKQPRSYCRQFLEQKSLVSKEFLQTLDREMRSSSMISSGSTIMTSGQDTEEIFAPSLQEPPPMNWTAMGAAMLAGCIIGAVAVQRHRILQQLQRTFQN